MPQGLQQPQGFFQGLVGGVARGAVGRGERVSERRAKVEAAQLKRQSERDQANTEATQKYLDRRGTAMRDEIKAMRDEKAAQRKYEQENVIPTKAQIEAMPSLGRAVDENGRVPRDWVKPEKSLARISAEAAATRGPEPIVAVVGKDGKPQYVRQSQAIGREPAKTGADMAGKPAAQQAAAFYNRAADAVSTVSMVDKKGGQSLEDRIATLGTGGQFAMNAPNFMQSPDIQKYNQAKRAFAIALLRKESGAAISAGEYEGIDKAYFVQPGDTPTTIRQKRAARQIALEGMKFTAAPESVDATAPGQVEDWNFNGTTYQRTP
jgi:hypothetical protein